MTKSIIRNISSQIIKCAIEVHKCLGPGLLEAVYHECLVQELLLEGLDVKQEVWVPLIYKGQKLDAFYKMDLLVNDIIVVELKAVDHMNPIYKAQLLSYLKLSKKAKGLLINFHSILLKDQVCSLVTEEYGLLPE